MSIFNKIAAWFQKPCSFSETTKSTSRHEVLNFNKISPEHRGLVKTIGKTLENLEQAMGAYDAVPNDGLSVLNEPHLYLKWLDANHAYTKCVVAKNRIDGLKIRLSSSLNYYPERTYEEVEGIVTTALEACLLIEVFVKAMKRHQQRKESRHVGK